MGPLFEIRYTSRVENSVDPNHLDSLEARRSGSTLFQLQVMISFYNVLNI